MPALDFLELLTHTFFGYAKSILVLHMALFEVALEVRLKKVESSGINKK